MTPLPRRAISAALSYDRAATELAATTRAIGNALDRCPITQASDHAYQTDRHAEFFDDRDRVKHHLHTALQTVPLRPDFGVRRHIGSCDPIGDFLRDAATGCPHCAEAWRLIQARKVIRQQFGAAKRSIRAVAKAAARQQATP
jgi:hypothetical protein